MKSPVISGNCRHVLKKLESDEFDERMDAVRQLKEIGSEVVPGLLAIAASNAKKIEFRKSAIYALGEIGDSRAGELLLKIINGFWAGSADKREASRIKEKLTRDEHFGLAREAKAALIALGYNVEMKTAD